MSATARSAPPAEHWPVATRAPFGRRSVALLSVQTVGAYRVLSVADDLPRPAPGQFYMLATAREWGGGVDERPHLARACSVLRAPGGPGQTLTLQFMFDVVGPGTARLCAAREGEQMQIVGPLGTPFRAPPPGARAVLVGGGVGIAPLAILQDALLARGRVTTALLGFADAHHAQGSTLLADARVSSDDGAVGHRGLVTDLLHEELDQGQPDPHAPPAIVYACGPPAMLEAVRVICASRGVPVQLAMEAPMACGFGACHGCVLPTRDGRYLRVCVDGPVVDGERLASARAPWEVP